MSDETPGEVRLRRKGQVPWRQTLRSLSNRNYRTYLVGHLVSSIGMWAQQTAEIWLILEMTGSGTAVGMHSVLRFGPVLIFGAYGGLLSDRIDRRRLLVGSQVVFALAAVTITVAAWRDAPSLPLVYAIVLIQGLINAVDNPVRRAFIRDLVSDDELANAVGLHGSVSTLARTIGPAIGGLAIAAGGVRWAFLMNTVTYAAMLTALAVLDRTRLRPQVVAGRAPRQLRAGFAHAWHSTSIRTTLIICLTVAIFGWNHSVLVPFYATQEFGGGPSLYGMLLSLLSLGAFFGALATARLLRISGRYLAIVTAALAVSLLLTALAPTLPLGIVALFILGFTGTAAAIGAQARLQLNVEDAMSGRVLALYSVLFVGSKPIGGYLGGILTDIGGPRLAFAVGGVAVAVVLVALRPPSRWLRRRRPAELGAAPTAEATTTSVRSEA